jgi:hypothetical protein
MKFSQPCVACPFVDGQKFSLTLDYTFFASFFSKNKDA